MRQLVRDDARANEVLGDLDGFDLSIRGHFGEYQIPPAYTGGEGYFSRLLHLCVPHTFLVVRRYFESHKFDHYRLLQIGVM
jgi:hypothetical protein